MSAVPLVSVCIPVYRGADVLGAAIASVLAQTEADLELLVIDNASPDGTADVAQSFNDPRLRYLRNPSNLGPQGNWNRCLQEARGKYFKLLPHDDLLTPDCLRRQLAPLEADLDEHLALVFSARTVIGPDGKALTRRGCPGASQGPINASVLRRQCMRRGTNLIGEPGAVLMRRSLCQRIGAFDATYPYVVDLDYWFRALAHGDAWYCDEPLASFRVSRNQWSVTIGQDQSSDFREFIAKQQALGRLNPSFSDGLLARWTPGFNSFARMLFYRVYL